MPITHSISEMSKRWFSVLNQLGLISSRGSLFLSLSGSLPSTRLLCLTLFSMISSRSIFSPLKELLSLGLLSKTGSFLRNIFCSLCLSPFLVGRCFFLIYDRSAAFLLPVLVRAWSMPPPSISSIYLSSLSLASFTWMISDPL